MMFQARSSTRRGRLTAALVLTPFLLGLALLAGAGPAAAQEPWPAIKLYHSTDPYGADPRTESCPPGCRCDGSGPGGTTAINFDELEPGTVVAGQYPEASFAADGTVLEAYDFAGECGTSAPNWIRPMMDCSSCTEDVNVYFKSPVGNLSFTAAPTSNDYGSATVDVYELGELSATLNVNTDCSYHSTVDLSAYSNVTRIHIRNVMNNLAYDNFSFTTGGGGYDCVINGGANEEIQLWIDGGSTPGDGYICKLPPDGNTGDYLCGADVLLEITRGTGKITEFRPVIDTLVHSPVCQEPAGDDGFCPLPADTKRIRMNFRRGEGTLPLGPRKLADMRIDSTGSTQQAPTTVVVSGVEAASANLQVRPIAAGGPEVIAEGPVGPEEPCVLECDFNNDGVVGVQDLNALSANWGNYDGPQCTRPGPNPDPDWAGDCDCDGTVGLSDFYQLSSEWLKECPQ